MPQSGGAFRWVRKVQAKTDVAGYSESRLLEAADYLFLDASMAGARGATQPPADLPKPNRRKSEDCRTLFDSAGLAMMNC
jgi:hypothetical protein